MFVAYVMYMPTCKLLHTIYHMCICILVHTRACLIFLEKMPLAQSRLEILQVRKLINCVRMKETAAIRKLIENGIHGLINYQGFL